MIKRIIFAILSVIFVASCNGTGGEVETGKPSITLKESTITEFTLTFDVTVKNAFAASYVCVPSTSATPTELDVLSKGTPINKIGEEVSVTVYNLKPTTTYNILVVAVDDNDVITSSTLVMTTADEPTNVKLQASATTHKSFVFTITPTNADEVFYKMYEAGATATDADILQTGTSVANDAPSSVTLTPAKGNYFVAAVAKKGDKVVRATDLEFTIVGAEVVNVEIEKVHGKDYGTDMLYDIYIKNSEINVIKLDCYYHQGSPTPIGEYVYSKDEGYGKVVHSYSYTSFNNSTRLFFDGGTVKVESAENGQYTLKVNMTRTDEKVYDFTWTGVIQWN